MIKKITLAAFLVTYQLSAQTVLMNFGARSTSDPSNQWNSFANSSLGVIATNLIDTNNQATDIQLEITNAFVAKNMAGTSDPLAPYPSSATQNTFFDSNSKFDASGDKLAKLEFTGLDTSKTYDFTFYAARAGAGDVRSTLYTLEGGNSGSGALNASSNVTNTVSVSGIAPTAGGLITLTLTPDAETNTSPQDFIYLGVIELNTIPELSTSATECCSDNAPKKTEAFIFSPEQEQGRFFKSFQLWEAEDAGNLPKRDAILAIGSSSMRMWKSIKTDLAPAEVIHRGFGGSTMNSVLLMMNFFQRYESETVLVYQGDNDLVGKNSSVERYIASCQKFIDAILAARPDTQIYFLSTKPSPARQAALGRYKEANQRIEALCAKSEQLHYIDVLSPMMVDENTVKDDLFLEDQVHMNKKGYAIWTPIVRQALDLN
ncbi:GDSL-type esterase/lipase family protein [Coraliomargarita sp. W4R72]